VMAGVGEEGVRGEVTLVVEGGRPSDAPRGDRVAEAARLARELVHAGARKREAARQAAAVTGVPSGRIYQDLVGS
jgi:16S rRNA (cytidine1402-2'-O)-methyltransferase